MVSVPFSHQRRGIGRWLYERFEERARERGCTALKAITPPINTDSIAFHRRLGFSLLGEPNEVGIVGLVLALPYIGNVFSQEFPRGQERLAGHLVELSTFSCPKGGRSVRVNERSALSHASCS